MRHGRHSTYGVFIIYVYVTVNELIILMESKFSPKISANVG